jgi:hypothetical protein
VIEQVKPGRSVGTDTPVVDGMHGIAVDANRHSVDQSDSDPTPGGAQLTNRVLECLDSRSPQGLFEDLVGNRPKNIELVQSHTRCRGAEYF